MFFFIFKLNSTLLFISGENDVILVYTRHPPLSWSQTTLGLFKGSEQFLRGLAVITLLPLLKKRFGMKDTTIVIIGLISNCAEEIVLGLSSSTALLFIGKDQSPVVQSSIS